MNRKIKNILVVAIVIAIISFIGSFINSITGNPISAAIATSKIRNYVETTYPELDLEIPKATYNFKFSWYTSHIKSRTSEDTQFSVSWSKRGIYDSFESDVTLRYVTFQRLSSQFSKVVEEIIVKEFPYETTMAFADLSKSDSDIQSLVLDMKLDITNPPIPAALIVYLLNSDTSYEFLSSRLLELSELMNRHRIPIDTYTVVIDEPGPDGEKPKMEGISQNVYDFPAEKIKTENLIEAIKEHQNRIEANDKK